MTGNLYLVLMFAAGCSALTDTDPNGLNPQGGNDSSTDSTVGDSTLTDAPTTDAPRPEDATSSDAMRTDSMTPAGGFVGDPENCGAPGLRCVSGQFCFNGMCRCRPGLIRSEDGNGCRDPLGSPEACGTPPVRCEGNQVCAPGGCRGGCRDGRRECNGTCYDTDNNSFHCGDCNSKCGLTETCVDGSCRAYEGSECRTCPCASCVESECCGIDIGPVAVPVAVCIADDECPGRF